MNKYEHLFQPLKVGKTEIKNRIFMPPISTNLADKGYVTEELPEGATDVRYYINRSPFEHKSIYSFVLADEEDFDAFMEAHKITQDTELLRDETYWEFYGHIISTYNASYTKEELVEMAYVEEHFEEMDYKEMLSMCDHQFGFYNGYGAKVSDFIGFFSFST